MEKTTLAGITDVPTAGHYTVKLPDHSVERDILVDTMTRYLNGWQVDFGKYAEDWDLPGREGTKATVKIQPGQLMLGYGNVPGWVNFLAYSAQPYTPTYQRQHQLMIENFGYKMPYFQPQYVKQALCALGPKVRGWVAWNLGWDNDIASGSVQADPIEGLQETSFEVAIEKTACPSATVALPSFQVGDAMGYATYQPYTASQPLKQVACSDGANGLITRWGYQDLSPMFPYVAAISGIAWTSAKCGACYELTDVRSKKSVYLTVVDANPTPPPAGSSLHFNIAHEAFDTLFGDAGEHDGHGMATFVETDFHKCQGNKGPSSAPAIAV